VGGVFLAICRERLEIAHADERARARTHPRDVERVLDPPDERLRKRGAALGDLIDVAPRHGVVPRVEPMRHLLNREDVDVRRELVVDTPPEDLAGERGADVEMRDLRRGVHARVGAPGSVQFEVLTGGDGANGAVDLALYRARVFLNLPA